MRSSRTQRAQQKQSWRRVAASRCPASPPARCKPADPRLTRGLRASYLIACRASERAWGGEQTRKKEPLQCSSGRRSSEGEGGVPELSTQGAATNTPPPYPPLVRGQGKCAQAEHARGSRYAAAVPPLICRRGRRARTEHTRGSRCAAAVAATRLRARAVCPS